MTIGLKHNGNVRRETREGTEHLVVPVRAVKAMNLDGGYLPADEIKDTARAWNDTPVTLQHPRNASGDLTSASDNVDVQEQTRLGRLYNTEYDPGAQALDGEIWLNLDRIEQIGGEAQDVADMLENGDPVNVSTAYFGEMLDSGEYDGEFRENVVGNITPDHLAVLPNKEGKCGIEDGCAAGAPAPVANADTAIFAVAGGDGPADDPGSSGEASGDTGPTMSNDTDGDAADADTSASATTGDSRGDADGDGAESFGRRAGRAFANHLQKLGFSDHTMNRQDKIDVLVNEHGFTEDSLEGMGDSCLDQTHESFTNNDEAEDDADADDADPAPDADADDAGADPAPDADSPDASDDDTDTMTDIDALRDEIASLREEMATPDDVEQIAQETLAANEEEQVREALVDQIVANSDEYDAEALAETPVPVLENIRDDVATTSAANFAAQRGAAPAPQANGDDEAEQWTELVEKASGTPGQGGEN